MAEERRFTGLLDDQGNHIYEGDVVLWRAGFGVQGDIDKAFYQAKTVRFWERKKGSSYESRWLLDTIHNYWDSGQVRLAPETIDRACVDQRINLDIEGNKIDIFTPEQRAQFLKDQHEAGKRLLFGGSPEWLEREGQELNNNLLSCIDENQKRWEDNMDFFDPNWRWKLSRFKPWKKDFWRYWFRERNAAHRWPKVDITRGEDIKL
jgi:hypothetical protein